METVTAVSPDTQPDGLVGRAPPGRVRLVVAALLALPCWFGSYVFTSLGNDAYTDCSENCGHPNHAGAAADATFAAVLVLVPLVVAGLWRRSRGWRLIGVALAVLGVALVVLVVTGNPPDDNGIYWGPFTGAQSNPPPT